MKRRLVCLLCLTTAVAVASSVAQAAFDGSPKGGPASATGSKGICKWTSTLDPSPAVQMSSCPWITNALSAQGWNAGSGWTITTGVALTGTLEITKYYAWVTNQPVDSIGGNDWGGSGPYDCWGGAHFRVKYTHQGSDPTDINWIQAFATNCPTDEEKTVGYDAGGGYWQVLDNSETRNTNPFYDNDPPDPATETEFLDIPASPCPQYTCPLCSGTCSFEAQVFIATWNEGAKTITIYEDGIWWGFDISCVPEPGSAILLACGVLALLRRRARK